MKKVVGAGVAVIAVLALAGCGSNSSHSKSQSSSDKSSVSTKNTSSKDSHKSATSQSSTSSVNSQSSSTSSSSSSSDDAVHNGVPAELIGLYQDKVKQNESDGFAPVYEFTADSITLQYSNMPSEKITNVTWKMQNGEYLISGTGQPSGLYKGGPETLTVHKNGDELTFPGMDTNGAYRTSQVQGD
ncbi:hypothetical protein ABTQ33_02170 [Paucilactobacillus suebicus]|uniref:Lipoprotein n=1 Tax=Paucilactobacillus suebicus DSM 5007 = KCTC 3549 TaxID=1423807 RepID=A0A0R1W3Q6_9LACO|nr:hypothetical protein [Paucilactobacillus suebicus]KRM12127.1 hypothetical protein FD16_GL000202 [Paucilactobacillus suebicus DSM 5007 = KCTC 3549]